jgi:hypothetical protein
MAVVAAAAVGAAVSIGGAAIADGKAKRDARQARRDKNAAQAELDRVKSQRQDIINPYENVKDLSGMMSNPFAQLGVATQAAEIQMEQSDIALANTLDTIRSTGASAGGATALAQAALESKKGVSASIEQQEAQNEKLKASGQQALEQQKIAESQRLQQLEAAGKQFEFQVGEDRTNADLDRASGQIAQAQANEASAKQASAAAWGGAISAVGGIASSAVGALGK